MRRPDRRRALTALLAVRHARAAAAGADAAAATASRSATETALARRTADLAGDDLAAGPWFAAVLRRDLLALAAVRAGQEAAAAAADETAAQRRWADDRRAERVLERLVERLDTAERAAAVRREQRRLDELATTAHGRRAVGA